VEVRPTARAGVVAGPIHPWMATRRCPAVVRWVPGSRAGLGGQRL